LRGTPASPGLLQPNHEGRARCINASALFEPGLEQEVPAAAAFASAAAGARCGGGAPLFPRTRVQPTI